MRTYYSTAAISIAIFFSGCSQKNTENDFKNFEHAGECYQAKLEKKGICGQRVVKILDDDKSGLAYADTWTDSSTGITYVNVFSVKNSCDFPAEIKEGDTFTFIRVSQGSIQCSLCEAYTPVPGQEMVIKVHCENDRKK